MYDNGPMTTTTGFLHPGAMGSAVAAACAGTRLWAGDGRSPATFDRASAAELTDVGSVAAMCEQADTIISICPPDQAVAVAEDVAGYGFTGRYVDANAISPATTERIGAMFDRFVDGGIVGPPPHRPGSTRMYLSGDDAPTVAQRWEGSPLEVRAIDGGVGAASALKVCFAAWSKGTNALLLNINALAAASGITDALHAEWAVSRPDHPERSELAARFTAPKAWRFAGEMEEIAATFADAGLPHEFHLGAADLYRRLTEFKDADSPALDDVLTALLGSAEAT